MSGAGSKDAEYALSPLPLTARLPLVAAVMLWASLTLDPSAPYLAAWWGSAFPLASLIAGTLLATVTLSIFSSLSGTIGSKKGLTYALAAEGVYGVKGSLVPATWAGIVCVGWLAFSIGVVVDGILALTGLPRALYYVLVALLTGLFSVTAYLGVRHIVKLAYVGVPLLVALIVAAVVLGGSKWGLPSLGGLDARAVSAVFGLVLGTFVNGSITLSFDYQRFCRSPRDAVIVAFTNFLGFWSFIILLAALPAAVLGLDLYGAYKALGLLPLAVLALFMLAWTSTDNQLYSASLSWSVSLKNIGRAVERRKVVVAAAVLTILLAFARLHDYALYWLSLLTAVSLPAGVVIWTHYYVVRRRSPSEASPPSVNVPAFLAWTVGSIAIYLVYVSMGRWYGIFIGFLLAFIVYLLSARR